jgi:EAL domain-containing protein (putative c-di-GMP-specific phosphodiesterase class I)/GGDEF domain-containing protein
MVSVRRGERASAPTVTSARLGARAEVRNRLFPRTRSWFALASPMELLTPLAVLRLLLPLLAVGLGTALAVGPRPHAVASGTGAGAFALAWVALQRPAALSRRRAEAWGWAMSLALAVEVGLGTGGPVGPVALGGLVLVGLYSGLFLGPQGAARLGGATIVAAGLAWIPGLGVGGALLAAGGFGVLVAAVGVTVGMLVRSNHRNGTVDPETGLLNGQGLAEARALEDPDQPCAVVAVSLLGLTDAREALGYRVGSELLRRAVEDLGQVLPEGATISRVGGDELLVVQPLASDGAPAGPSGLPPTALGAATGLAGTLVETLHEGRYLVGDIQVALRPHAGVAVAPWHGRDVTDLARRASTSATRAATSSRPWVTWDRRAATLDQDDLALLADLRQAIHQRQLYLAYQPQIDPRSGRASAVEALLRWQHPERGLISPGVFIPLAERTGLIGELTSWVLDEALDAQVRWRAAAIDLPVSVNLSARLLTRPDLASWVIDALGQRRVPSTALCLEVTETAATPDLLEAIDLLRPLHQRGVRVSIDDFGTGYTSLSVLPHLPLSELKVDQRFVLRSLESAPDAAIVQSLAELAHRLKLTSVAEGVETLAHSQLMTDLGFDLLQGFLFARPLPEADLLAGLTSASWALA